MLLRPGGPRRHGGLLRGGRPAAPDRLRGRPRPALRHHRRALRGADLPRRPRAAGRQGPGARHEQLDAARRAADGPAHRRPRARLRSRRDDRRDGPAGAQPRRGRRPRQRHHHGDHLGPGQRVPLVLHDARGVRTPALRGRLDLVRAVCVEPPPRLAHRPVRPPCRRSAGPVPLSLRPDQRRARRRRPVLHRRGERRRRRAAGRRAAAGAGDLLLAGGPARIRPSAGLRLRANRAHDRRPER